MTEQYRCYLNGQIYGQGPIDYMHELFVDYVITCGMYGRDSVDWRIEKYVVKNEEETVDRTTFSMNDFGRLLKIL